MGIHQISTLCHFRGSYRGDYQRKLTIQMTYFVKSQVGLVIATCLWYVSNKFLLKPTIREQDVEWGFCFDVHLNAFIPILVILHFVQLFIYHAIIGKLIILSLDQGNPKQNVDLLQRRTCLSQHSLETQCGSWRSAIIFTSPF